VRLVDTHVRIGFCREGLVAPGREPDRAFRAAWLKPAGCVAGAAGLGTAPRGLQAGVCRRRRAHADERAWRLRASGRDGL